MLLAWLVVVLALAAVPAAAAPVRLVPASGEAGARTTLLASELPPGSRVELRVGRRPVDVLSADSRGRVVVRERIPPNSRSRVRIALRDARGQHAVLHYRVGSRWSNFRAAASADWAGRVLRVAADLRRGKLLARAQVHGLSPGQRVVARYGGRAVGRAEAGEEGVALLQTLLPQDAAGRQLRVRGRGVDLIGTLPTPPATVVAVADIACRAPYETSEQRCRHAETATLTERLEPDVVAIAGDVQYDDGRLSEFRGSFHPTWGQLSAPIRAVPGNHEYRTPGASGFFDYFAWQAGWRPPPWYAYDVGPWRLIALNSNCEPERVDCVAEEQWLRANLDAEPHRCTLAYWHHPRFSSGFHGSDPRSAGLWSALDAAGAEIVISGHDHHYERFAPQDVAGQLNPDGIRQFVVGTGGNAPSVIREPLAPHSERRQNTDFGVLLLRLYEDAYSWRFVALGGRVLDSGNGSCV